MNILPSPSGTGETGDSAEVTAVSCVTSIQAPLSNTLGPMVVVGSLLPLFLLFAVPISHSRVGPRRKPRASRTVFVATVFSGVSSE